MPWDEITGTGYTYGNTFTVYDSGTSAATTTDTNVITLRYNTTSATTLTFDSNGYTDVWADSYYSRRRGNNLWYSNAAVSGYYPSEPVWDPAQVQQLRIDLKALKEDRERRRAEVKARKLFRHVIGDVAYYKFRQKKYHEIKGASGTRYRLRPGLRVQIMGQGDEVVQELCAHLPFGIPWYDSMAVQHLMLSSCEETENKFISIANKHRAHGPYPVPELEAVA